MQIIRTDTPINLTIPSRKPTTGQVVLTGLQFDGVSTYMDLGIVPMLNSADSYFKASFKATDWNLKQIFGYDNGGNDNFWFYRIDAENKTVWRLQNGSGIDGMVLGSNDKYQEYNTTVDDWANKKLITTIDGNEALPSSLFSEGLSSGLGFYLGCYNQGGVANGFAEVIFTELEFFNGVELKTFNAANSWNGATNYGGVEVYSIDGGTTWTETYPTQEEIDKINVFNINIITENEGDRTEFIETVEATYSNGQLSFEMEFTPIESTFYFSRVRNESANRELLKFKSFCTNQTDLQDYTTSEGLYITPPQSDNDFIVIQ